MNYMKNISDLVPTYEQAAHGSPERMVSHHAAEHVMTQQDVELINQVFSELKSIFPAWKTAFSNADDYKRAKRSWSKALVENNICTVEQIQNGFRKARQSNFDFWPSCGKFIGWCQSVDSERFPSPQDAFRMFSAYQSGNTRKNLPEVVQAAFAQIDKRTLKYSKERDLWEIFQHTYEVVCRKAIAGQDIHELIPKALPKTVERVLSDEEKEQQRIKRLAQVKSLRKGLFKRG